MCFSNSTSAGFSTPWLNSSVYLHRFHFPLFGPWCTRSPFSLFLRTHGIISLIVPSIGALCTRPSIKSTTSIRHPSVWPPNMRRLLRSWFLGLGPLDARFSGVHWLATCISLRCMYGLSSGSFRPLMHTAAMSFLGVSIISCPSGLELITMISTMRNLSATMRVASGGGITFSTLNTHLKLLSAEGRARLQKRLSEHCCHWIITAFICLTWDACNKLLYGPV